MNITTTAKDFESSPALDAFIRDQLFDSLEHFAENIIAVDVYLKDENGPKGGIDQQALIRVRLRNRQLVATETKHENVYAAVRLGVKRTRRAVRRQLHRSRHIDKRRLYEHLDDSFIATVPES
jgi:ribosomal subunit interface protein